MDKSLMGTGGDERKKRSIRPAKFLFFKYNVYA